MVLDHCELGDARSHRPGVHTDLICCPDALWRRVEEVVSCLVGVGANNDKLGIGRRLWQLGPLGEQRVAVGFLFIFVLSFLLVDVAWAVLVRSIITAEWFVLVAVLVGLS